MRFPRRSYGNFWKLILQNSRFVIPYRNSTSFGYFQKNTAKDFSLLQVFATQPAQAGIQAWIPAFARMTENAFQKAIMNRKHFLLVFPLISIGLFLPSTLFAKVYISEIMYDVVGLDDGREWVEIYNGSDTPINFSRWKFFEANTNHGLTLASLSIGTTSPGQFAVFVSNAQLFLKDNPSFSGTLFDSAFSLGNKGEVIALKNNKGEIVDSVTYTAQGKSGQSLQFINGEWLASAPTPGMENKFVVEVKPAPAPIPSSTKTTASKKSPPSSVVSSTAPKNVSASSQNSSKEISPTPEASIPQSGSNLWVWIGALASLIVVTLIALHFIEEKKVLSQGVKPLQASDFEITEEIEEEI